MYPLILRLIPLSKNNDTSIIDLTPENIADYGVCGYKDVEKHLELQRKIAWFTEYYPKGLTNQSAHFENRWLPRHARIHPRRICPPSRLRLDGYMFIHCIFVGFKAEFKGKGYASAMLDVCINEAKEQGMKGVAVVTRKGSFMAKKDIFRQKRLPCRRFG